MREILSLHQYVEEVMMIIGIRPDFTRNQKHGLAYDQPRVVLKTSNATKERDNKLGY